MAAVIFNLPPIVVLALLCSGLVVRSALKYWHMKHNTVVLSCSDASTIWFCGLLMSMGCTSLTIRCTSFVTAGADRQSGWSRTASTLNRWLWGAVCCGLPGVPCFFCTCCQRLDDNSSDRDRPRVNQSTATMERIARPHRPHAPRGRKHTPETLSAVRCALSQLQGEPAPPMLPDFEPKTSQPG